MKINDKVVLITGASRGIGAACAVSFRRRGARLSLVARSGKLLASVGGSDAVITAGDLTEAETRRRCVEATIAKFGRIDILVNNAGVGLYSPSWRADMDHVRRLMELNFFVPMEMVQLVAPHMIGSGSGLIVNVGSIAGKVTLPWMTVYSASKSAIEYWTNGLRSELKSRGVRAMTVCPSYVQTEFHDHMISGEIPESIQRSRKFAISAGQCGEAIAKGVEKEARTVMAPRVGWIFVVAERLLPSVVDGRLYQMYRSVE